MSDKPKRIQRKRTKGWRMPENTVYVGRPSKWGNPFKVGDGRVNTPGEAVQAFRMNLLFGRLPFNGSDVERELGGKDVACWCEPGSVCHADVLLEIANPQKDEEL